MAYPFRGVPHRLRTNCRIPFYSLCLSVCCHPVGPGAGSDFPCTGCAAAGHRTPADAVFGVPGRVIQPLRTPGASSRAGKVVPVAACRFPGHHPMVVSVDTGPLRAGAVPVGFANMGISPPYVVVVRPVVGVSNRVVIPTVRMAVNHAVSKGRPYKKPVKGPEGVDPVIGIDIPDMVVVKAQRGIEDTHTSEAIDPTVSIGDPYISNPIHPSIEIVVNGYVLYLYHGSVVVVLHKGVVIKPGIEGDRSGSEAYPGLQLYLVVDVKIKFSIRIDREGYSVFQKDEGIGIPEHCRCCNLIFRGVGPGVSNSQQKDHKKEYKMFHGDKVLSSGCNYLHPPLSVQAPCQKQGF